MRQVTLKDERRAYLTRAEALTFELMRKHGIVGRSDAKAADVVFLVAELNERLLDEFPHFPRSYVTFGFVDPPARLGKRWTIEFHAYERGVEFCHETIRSA